MKFLLATATLLVGLAAAVPMPAQAPQAPPTQHIGIPALENRAGLDHAGIAPGDCSVKGVSCKQNAIKKGILKSLFLKTGGGQ